jgi:hypothetical protein
VIVKIDFFFEHYSKKHEFKPTMSEQKKKTRQKKPEKPKEFKTERTTDIKFAFPDLNLEFHLVKHVEYLKRVEYNDLFHLTMSEEEWEFKVEGGYTIRLVKHTNLGVEDCPVWFCGYIELPENHILNDKDVFGEEEEDPSFIFRACGFEFPPDGITDKIMTARFGFDTCWKKYSDLSLFDALKIALQYVNDCQKVQAVPKDEVLRLIQVADENDEDEVE